MKKIIPLAKMSKKEQREFYAQKRGSWNGVCPVTRSVPLKTAYNRNAMKQQMRGINEI